ncbi:NAD(P)(+)--arginine ADP-ribosyltransferase 2-like [Sinocyclocheilus anshuiensis]|uniref:NAD(P)(+)--arginine ADP-ribosyltransferase 2-like n=1 Tax=Sinocyclocheilus anshuiensis TaxID=1608454 RepID=UPI0007B890AA|nr:PREDICTED: NAD(P)(+)--arginine ADP-ribosyltransferase 2-like [Sinocyclocheilus anshuiensis]
MLLIIEALLLILAALGQDHRAAAVSEQIFPLDMAPNSVDDQYISCKGKMAHLVKTKYLEKEMKNSAKFKYYWQNSEKFVKFPKDHLTRNHLVALHVYTGKYIYRQFNDDTRYGRKQYKHKTFSWYSLHFLLTEAIQILKKTQNKCYLTYRGTTANFDKYVLNKEIRFGSFTSSSLNLKVTQGFGTKSCFEIITCESAELTKYSQYPYIKEVLIPPYEKFRVTAVRTKQYYKDLWCDTVFTLKSSGRTSYMNCALFKKQ